MRFIQTCQKDKFGLNFWSDIRIIFKQTNNNNKPHDIDLTIRIEKFVQSLVGSLVFDLNQSVKLIVNRLTD